MKPFDRGLEDTLWQFTAVAQSRLDHELEKRQYEEVLVRPEPDDCIVKSKSRWLGPNGHQYDDSFVL